MGLKGLATVSRILGLTALALAGQRAGARRRYGDGGARERL